MRLFRYFRNPLVKRDILVNILLTVISTVIGFVISISCGFAVLSVSILFSIVFMISTARRYDDISNLSEGIDRILHNDDIISLTEYSEGELSVLHNEISKLTIKLREKTDALQNEKVYLSNSLADISHQIRTPLTSINLILSLISQAKVDDQRRIELALELTRLISQIDWLITALLKISKLDAGTVNFQCEPVLVSEVIKKAAASVEIPMELKNQQLIITSNGDEIFIGDMYWTIEAISNILKNCMEHTPFGKTIRINTTKNPVYTEIVVSDSGEGFDEKDLGRIFERFYKGKNSSDSSYGIGLALARQIINQQNGTIKAENSINGGASFIIRFYKVIV